MAKAKRMEWNYEASRLGFDEILCRTMKTVHRYLDMATEFNTKVYRQEAFGLLSQARSHHRCGDFLSHDHPELLDTHVPVDIPAHELLVSSP